MLRVKKVNMGNFKDIPSPCRCCTYWQTRGEFGEQTLKPEMEHEKREWFKNVIEGFGNCMNIAYSDDTAIGFIQYAPARCFPRTGEYVAGPPSDDSVLLTCLYVTKKEERGKGYGTAMLKHLVAELKEQKVKAIETFARKSSADNPSGPLKLYLKHDFKIRSEEDDFPLVRLDL